MSTPPKDPKPCPECDRQVRRVAQQCKYCGHRFPFDRKAQGHKQRERARRRAANGTDRPRNAGAQRVGYWIGTALIVVAVYQFIQNNKPEPPPRDYGRERQAERYYDCVDRSSEPNATLSYAQCRKLYGDAVRPGR